MLKCRSRWIPLILLLPVMVSAAHADSLRIATDDFLRAQLRLRDLGYYAGSIDGTNSVQTRAALSTFYERNGLAAQTVPPAALYASSALSASVAPSEAKGAIVITGEPLSWKDAAYHLTEGEVYSLVSCYTGLSIQMRYTGGAGHAHMTPVDDEAADALKQLFGELHTYSKQPVVIQLDEISAASSLQAYLHNDEAGDADTVYSLYFTDSVSDIGDLIDSDHVATVRIAAGG